MKIDRVLGDADWAGVAAAAEAAEAAGYDGFLLPETKRDPFPALALAAEHTGRIEVGTGIAVAFARTPMTMAYLAHGLQAFSGGRLVLGLGSQIEAHVRRRFSMPWSKPAARMREFIEAMRAIWRCWDDGERLKFEGEFYSHTLMTPFFEPGPQPYGPPKVLLAAVGPAMVAVAADVADGLVVHSFNTERYLRDVVLPVVDERLSAQGRGRTGFQMTVPVFVVTGRDEAELAAADEAVRKQVAFYASTPSYRAVLDLHGWGDLQPELHRLSRAGDWDAMRDLVDDEMLAAFAVVGEPDAVGPAIRARVGGIADRLHLYTPHEAVPEIADAVAASARQAFSP